MKLEHSDIIKAPPDKVFSIVRDKLPDLASYLCSVAKVEQVCRESINEYQERIVSNWFANIRLPALLGKFTGESLLAWKDTAIWDDKKKEVTYTLESFFINDLFDARGRNYFECSEGGQTKLIVTCEVYIYPEKIPGIPRLIMKRITPAIEKIVEKMLRPNITSLGRGLRVYLQEQEKFL